MAFLREHELYDPVAKFMKNRTFRKQAPEVQFYDYRMDIYGYSARADLTVAVELKLTKWTRALEQALIYQLCSDLVYIALPDDQIHRVDTEALMEHGIGLISVSKERCREIVKAIPSQVVREHYRAEYRTRIQGGT